MPTVAAFVGYTMPHFDDKFFEGMAPTLLGVGDTIELMPFIATPWFAQHVPEITPVEMIRQGTRLVSVLQSKVPRFCVGEPMNRMPWVSVVSHGSQPTYVITRWCDDGMTYGIHALIAGQHEAEHCINRLIEGDGQHDTQIAKRPDGTLAAMARGRFKSNRPWYKMAFGLPWDGRILNATNVVLGDRRSA